jgi:hypothetical protein
VEKWPSGGAFLGKRLHGGESDTRAYRHCGDSDTPFAGVVAMKGEGLSDWQQLEQLRQ